MASDKAFEKAEKKIDEALRSRATKLTLHDMKLNELPESLGQFTPLRTLDQLTPLRTLDLSGNSA